MGSKSAGGRGPEPAADSGGPVRDGAVADGLGPVLCEIRVLGAPLLPATLAGPLTPGSRFPASWGSPPAAAMITATPAAAPIARTALRLRAWRRTRW